MKHLIINLTNLHVDMNSCKIRYTESTFPMLTGLYYKVLHSIIVIFLKISLEIVIYQFLSKTQHNTHKTTHFSHSSAVNVSLHKKEGALIVKASLLDKFDFPPSLCNPVGV